MIEPADQVKQLLQALRHAEPIIIAAGDEALKRQSSAKWNRKLDTGNLVIDIVTESDLMVQEATLSAFAKTELKHCTLFAEEQTPTTEQFVADWPFVLTLDPIDGTKIYADGGRFFSTIVTLHDRKTILYTFRYYPALKIVLRIEGNQLTQDGQWPQLKPLTPPWTKRVIYISPGDEADLEQVSQELEAKGLILTHLHGLDEAFGEPMSTSTSFFMGIVAGYYCGRPNVYDGLTTLHYARAQGYDVVTRGQGGHGELDLADTFKDSNEMYRHPGYYYALRPSGL